jgi:hypothetical protein
MPMDSPRTGNENLDAYVQAESALGGQRGAGTVEPAGERAVSIAYDVAFNHRRQPMGVMNFVFPITALYFGPFALALHWRWARAAARTTMASTSTSRAAVSQTAVASAGDGMQMHGGQDAYPEMAGTARPDGADEPAPPGEHARPW